MPGLLEVWGGDSGWPFRCTLIMPDDPEKLRNLLTRVSQAEGLEGEELKARVEHLAECHYRLTGKVPPPLPPSKPG